MASPTQSEANIFNEKFDRFWLAYKAVTKGAEITSKQLESMLIEFDLSRKGKVINYKALSSLLIKKGLLSQKKWMNDAISKYYNNSLLLIESGEIKRADVIIQISETFGRSINGVNSILRNSNKASRINCATNELFLCVLKMVKSGCDWEQAKLAWGRSTTSQLKSMLENEPSIKLDKDYFLNTDINYRNLEVVTAQNAHLWGWIYADGSVTSGQEVVVRISEKDRDYLEEMAQSLVIDGSRTPIISKVPSCKLQGSYSDIDKLHLTISRQHFTRFLIDKLGMPQNKETKFHGLPKQIKQATDEIFYSFLQGFFEGDGYFTEDSKRPQIGFSVNAEIGNDIKDQIYKRLGFKGCIVKDKSIYRLSYASRPCALVLMLKLYSTNNIRMARKFTRAQKLWARHLGVDISLVDVLKESTLDIHQHLSRQIRSLNWTVKLMKKATQDTFWGSISEFTKKTEINRKDIKRLMNDNNNQNEIDGWVLISFEYPFLTHL
ncbi:LAGLIDADG family homing endonuclease [Shewanella phaeophyticola]|uniref:DOD-type homing endonuclease domain-containing protein n=1 Tax=Shewanella phaeophyticola TaxID=2978345 RepID=A0ABT2NZX4_9GAMM|nr:hypothetical protein [Shewanella sp. KJ10-1]MCT8985944.1 hypothetical protein [Shewanella sp. KJ10-1]